MVSPSAVLNRLRIARPEAIPRTDYLLRQGVLKLLAVKDSDVRILTLEQCRDAVDKGLHAGGAFSAVIPLTALYYGGFIDFDIADPSAVDKDTLTRELNALIAADHPVSDRWISDAELEANPGLVRTLSVKPPMGTGRVRLVAIGENGSVDLQPCGGTHVARTGEIGRVAVTKIENKGKMNRRIRVSFA